MQNKATFLNFLQFSQAFNNALEQGVTFAVADEEGDLTQVQTAVAAANAIKDLEISWLILTFKDGKKASINFVVDFDYETKKAVAEFCDYSMNERLIQLFKNYLGELAD